MSEPLWGVREVEHLTEGDLLDGAFECLRRIWQREDALDGKVVAGREYRTRLLEYELTRQYPGLYDDLVGRVGNHPLTELDDGCGVIMDALSLREGFQLERELSAEFDWEVSFDWAAVEALPTETEFIADAWFGANGGKQASMKHDDVTYLGEPEVPQLPGTDPEYVWSRFPDKRLHSAQEGKYTITELREVYEEAKELLIEIVNESAHDEFLVTSDHGYVNFSGNNPYRLSEEHEEILKDKFSGRFREVENSGLLRKLEEDDITLRNDDYFMVRGHYDWTTRSASSKITHGGVSLTEVMTPTLSIKTNEVSV